MLERGIEGRRVGGDQDERAKERSGTDEFAAGHGGYENYSIGVIACSELVPPRPRCPPRPLHTRPHCPLVRYTHAHAPPSPHRITRALPLFLPSASSVATCPSNLVLIGSGISGLWLPPSFAFNPSTLSLPPRIHKDHCLPLLIE